MPLKILTLNLWHDSGPYARRAERLRAWIRRLDPDLLGFQEALRVRRGDQVAELLDGLGYHLDYVPASPFWRRDDDASTGDVGNAVLLPKRIGGLPVAPIPLEAVPINGFRHYPPVNLPRPSLGGNGRGVHDPRWIRRGSPIAALASPNPRRISSALRVKRPCFRPFVLPLGAPVPFAPPW